MTNYSPKHFTPAIGSGYANGLTKEVATFVSATNAEKIPTEVFDLAKKSILDGFGLALSGSVAASGKIVQAYLKENNCSGRSSVIGTDIKTSGRFAAFANGIGIHADDFDDTQLAVAEDRVYGLLTHPTASCLPQL
jgi:2-methylcitrate dehydratase PrpD